MPRMRFYGKRIAKWLQSISNDTNTTSKNKLDMDYGKVFKEIRQASNTSRPQMANDLGITASALWKIEHGKASPKKETISRFCRISGIPIAYFYIRCLEKEDFFI